MQNIYTTGNDVVDIVGKMNFSGNIIPHNWYKRILRENGKPNVNAIIILSDIVYWYRPEEIRDEYTGQLIGYRKRFAADALQRSYEQISDMFGFTKRQATEAIIVLENIGVVKRDLRTIEKNGTKIGNVLYLLLNPEVLYEITYNESLDTLSHYNGRGVTLKSDRGHIITGEVSHYNGKAVTLERETNTENTTENTTESTTTKNDVVEKTKNQLTKLNLKQDDILSICKAADYDVNKIVQAYEIFKNQTCQINNIVGWFIKAIENNYSSQVVNKNKFNNFSQRDYDMTELEKKLLRQQN